MKKPVARNVSFGELFERHAEEISTSARKALGEYLKEAGGIVRHGGRMGGSTGRAPPERGIACDTDAQRTLIRFLWRCSSLERRSLARLPMICLSGRGGEFG